MTAASPTAQGLRRVLKARAYHVFYRLPSRLRRRLVRLGTPAYTVGAVTLVRDPDRRLLLLRQPPNAGWTLPGGLLHRGEEPAAGAARELAEETGLRVPPDRLRAAVPNALVHAHGGWVDMVFELDSAADPPLVVDGAEVYEARFFPVDDLPPLSIATVGLLASYGLGPGA
jgi:ADP-ribose pyrophosphatase YjhB (NUDIX family)